MGIDDVRRIPRINDTGLLTESEAAQLLKIQPATLASWRVRGWPHLPFVRVGRCVRYRPQDIVAFIERHLATASRRGQV